MFSGDVDAMSPSKPILPNTNKLVRAWPFRRKYQHDVHGTAILPPALIANQPLQCEDSVAQGGRGLEVEAVRFMVSPPTKVV